jgi:inosine-uridine nucleoside N-ribohydrolase
MQPVIVDVDTGVDDALALAVALAQPELRLIAVTTVAGNVDVGQATRNTRLVLDWLGARSIPVAKGAASPLLRKHLDARAYHGPDGLGGAVLPVERGRPRLDTRAP